MEYQDSELSQSVGATASWLTSADDRSTDEISSLFGQVHLQ